MSEHSAFDRQPLQEAPLLAQPGLLDQLGLPPNAVRFLRKHQKRAWIIIGCVVAVIAAVSAYNSYIEYRDGKAASALTEAMKAEEGKRAELLGKVASDYGSTGSGMWAQIELARLAVARGDAEGAIAGLQAVRKETDSENPLMPLLLFQLAVLYENNNDPDQALALYGDLSGFDGFAPRAWEAMGRIYDRQGNKEKAVEMYEKYLGEGEGKDAAPALPGAADPEREIIQARLKALRE